MRLETGRAPRLSASVNGRIFVTLASVLAAVVLAASCSTYRSMPAQEKLAKGKLEFGAGVEAGAGKSDVGTGAGGVAGSKKDKYSMYQLSEAGVSATFTVNVTQYSVIDLGE